jgi:hypothetical protein
MSLKLLSAVSSIALGTSERFPIPSVVNVPVVVVILLIYRKWPQLRP